MDQKEWDESWPWCESSSFFVSSACVQQFSFICRRNLTVNTAPQIYDHMLSTDKEQYIKEDELEYDFLSSL